MFKLNKFISSTVKVLFSTMPQVFQVLRCFKCLVFQVHQTKKSNKWQCKLCGEKQSVKRHYGIGNGKECRLHVQKLNNLRGTKDEADHNLSDKIYESGENDDIESGEDVDDEINTNKPTVTKNSKWETYIDKSEELKEINDETMYIDNKEVLEIPKKRKCVAKLGKAKITNNKTCKMETETYKVGNLINNQIDKTNKYINNNYGKKTKYTDKQIAENTKWGDYIDENEEQSDLKINCDSLDYCKKEFLQKNQLQKSNEPIRECSLEIEEGKLHNSFKNDYFEEAVINIENVIKPVDIKSKKQLYLTTNDTKTHSIWNKFLKDEEKNPELSKTATENMQTIFSLCDDDNLDNVLDF